MTGEARSGDDRPSAAEQAAARERIFLVVVDESEEMKVALHFACLRVKHTGGRVALLYVQETAEFQHWMAVGDLMREEAREQGEELLQKLSAEVHQWAGSYPVLYMREGDRAEELLKLLEEEPSISILVLGAGTGSGGPGPIVSYLTGKGASRLNIPVTIVPGSLDDEHLKVLT